MRILSASAPDNPALGSPARFLLWLGGRHAGPLAAGTLWACLWMVGMAVTPFAIGRAIDAVIARDSRTLLIWSGVLLGIGISVALGSIMRHRCDTAVRLATTYRTIRLVNRQATRLGAKLEGSGSGEVVAVSVAMIMLVTSVPVGLLVLIGVPLLIFGTGPLLRPLHRRAEKRRDRQADLTERAVDIVAGLRALRGIGGDREFTRRYRRDSEQVRDAGVHVARIESMLTAAEVLLPGLLALGVVWLSTELSLRGALTPGDVVTFYGFTAFLSLPMRIVTELANDAVAAHVAAGRVVKFLSLPAVDAEAGRHVSGPLTLADPESGLVVEPGKLTAVATAAVDEDGVRLAARLGGYEPGEATLAGVPVAELAPRHLRDQVLVSDHRSYLFSGPLEADLGTDDPDRTAAALRAACASDIIEALPDGLRSTVSERGLSFSGGEQQRLKLVRALLTGPPVLVLVDPTSAVDATTEVLIAQRLRASRAGSTTIVITNSPHLLDQADEVAFVSAGRVVATGTHEELAISNPDYARTVLREQL